MFSNKNLLPQLDEKKQQKMDSLSLLELQEIILNRVNSGYASFITAQKMIDENELFSINIKNLALEPIKLKQFWELIQEATRYFSIEDTIIDNVLYYKNNLNKENTRELYNNTLDWLNKAYFYLGSIQKYFIHTATTLQEYFKHTTPFYKYYFSIIDLTTQFNNPTNLQKNINRAAIENFFLYTDVVFFRGATLAKNAGKDYISFVPPELLEIFRKIAQYANSQIQQNYPFKIFNKLRLICHIHLYPFDLELLEDDLLTKLQEEKSNQPTIQYQDIDINIFTGSLFNIVNFYIDKLIKDHTSFEALEANLHLLKEAHENIKTPQFNIKLLKSNGIIEALRVIAQVTHVFERTIKNLSPQTTCIPALKEVCKTFDMVASYHVKTINAMICGLTDWLNTAINLFNKAQDILNTELRIIKINEIISYLVELQNLFTQMSVLLHYPPFIDLRDSFNQLGKTLYNTLAGMNFVRHSQPSYQNYYDQSIIDIHKAISYQEHCDSKKEDLIKFYSTAISIITPSLDKNTNNPAKMNNILKDVFIINEKLGNLSRNNEYYPNQVTYYLLHRPPQIINAIASMSSFATLFITSLEQNQKQRIPDHIYNQHMHKFFINLIIHMERNLIDKEYVNLINAASHLIALIKLHKKSKKLLQSSAWPLIAETVFAQATDLRAYASILNNDFKSYHSDFLNLSGTIISIPPAKLAHALSNEKLMHFVCKIRQAHIASDIGHTVYHIADKRLDYNFTNSLANLTLAIQYYEEAEFITKNLSESEPMKQIYLGLQKTLYQDLNQGYKLLNEIYLKQTPKNILKITHTEKKAGHYAELLSQVTEKPLENTPTSNQTATKKTRKKFKPLKVPAAKKPIDSKLTAEIEKERRLKFTMKQDAMATAKAALAAEQFAAATKAAEEKKAADDQLAEKLKVEKILQAQIAQTKRIEKERREKIRAERDAAKEKLKAEMAKDQAAKAAQLAKEEKERDDELEKQWQKNLKMAADAASEKEKDRAKKQHELEKNSFLTTIISKNSLDDLYNLAMDLINNLGAEVELGGSLIPKLALFLHDKNKTPIAISDIDIFVRSKEPKPYVYGYTPLNSNKEIKATLSDRLVFRKFEERVRSDAKEQYTPPFSNHQRKTLDSNGLKIDLTVSYPGDKPKENLIPFTEQRMIFSDKEAKDPKSICIQFATNRYLVLKNHPHRDKFIENCEKGKFWLDELPDPYNINVTGYFDRLYGAYNKIKGKLKICDQTTKALSEPWQVAYFTRRFFAKTSKYQMPCYLEMAQLIRKGRIQKDDYRQPLQSFCLAALLHRHHNKEITNLIDRYYKEATSNKLCASSEKNIIAEIHNTCKNQGMILLAENITTILQLFYQKHPVESETIATTSIKDLFIRISKNLFDNRWNLQKKLSEDELQSWVKELEISEKLCPDTSYSSESPDSDSPTELLGYEENGLFGVKKVSTQQSTSSLSSSSSLSSRSLGYLSTPHG